MSVSNSTYDTNLFLDIFSNWFSEYSQISQRDKLNYNTFEYNLSFSIKTTSPVLDIDENSPDHIKKCKIFYTNVRNEYEPAIAIINQISFVIISAGILFNILNLVVLFRTKLNESPYTYLTVLALSDLGALSVISLEKIHQMIGYKHFIEDFFIIVITPMLNIFLSCSMYVTLALTIERFVFVHMPFRSKTICHRTVARRVCLGMFIFSFVRSIYLPFMYTKSECIPHAWVQKKYKWVDIYEFLVSLVLPYTIIFIANISLIVSLKKQNSLMRHTTFSNQNSIILGKTYKKKKSDEIFDITSEDSNKKKSKMESVYRPSKSSDNRIFYRTFNKREYRNQKKLTISLIFIMCSLLICYFPSFLFEEALIDALFGEFKYDLTPESARLLKLKGLGTRISLALIYLNCSCNFLIYCISNERFKKALLSLFILKRRSEYNTRFNPNVLRIAK